MANETKKIDSGVTFVNPSEELESLKKERDALNKAYQEQQRMMLNQLRTDGTNPFLTAVGVDQVEIVQKIKDLCDKHVHGGGLSQREATELYRYQNELTKIRKTTLSYEERGSIGADDMIPKSQDQRRVLETQVPPGYEGYWEVDTPSLGGRLLREKLNLGYRFMQNDASVRCEADGEVWNPSFQDSGIVTRRGGTYGRQNEPATYYLMVIAKVMYDERLRDNMKDINSRVTEDLRSKRTNLERELAMAGATDGVVTGDGLKRF